jgi:iron(III) transport system permease protein
MGQQSEYLTEPDGNKIKELKARISKNANIYWWSKWLLASLLLLAFVLTPMFTIFVNLFGPSGDQWHYISQNLMGEYLSNTVILVLGVGLVTFVLGVGCSWLVSTYEFPGRKYFEWVLILPLAFPSYILSYSYVGLLEYTGPLASFLRNELAWNFQGPILDIMNLKGAIFIMGISLFPYVYVLSRASFLKQSKDMQEISLLLNSTPLRTFLRVALPMARPAIAGGIALVAMEVLNDYGTVKYFGINTFTSGIFRAWFSLGDIQSAIYLAAIMSFMVLFLIVLENYHRGNKAWSKSSANNKPITRIYPRLGRKWIITALLFVVFLISFVFPLAQLLYWVTQTYEIVLDNSFFKLIVSSFGIAGISAIFIAIFSLLLLYALRLHPYPWMQNISRLASIGYAIPGAVIAVGVLLPFAKLDNILLSFFKISGGSIISGTLIVLMFAYIVRYLAVGYNAMDAGFQKTGRHVNEASRLLGADNKKTLWKVDLPLIKKSIASAVLLTFVDLLKELPLTLILRPFNFSTLATKAFDLATNEMIAEAANASSIIVLTGVIPVILLNKIITSKE